MEEKVYTARELTLTAENMPTMGEATHNEVSAAVDRVVSDLLQCGVWIPIKEQTPPLHEVVFVTDGEYIGLAALSEIYREDVFFWAVPGVGGYDWDFDDPTHWQKATLPGPLE